MPWGQSAEAASTEELTAACGTIGVPSSAADTGDSDLALIAAFLEGDRDAFDRLYRRHHEFVYNICLGILANPDDARDCTQETFLRVYRKAGDFRARAAVTTWLYRIAVNVAIGQLRQARHRPLSLEEEGVRTRVDPQPDACSDLARAGDEQRVREVVASLPEDYRTVLVLRYFQELSYEEMRDVLGYTLGQVKVKLHRARRAFARLWAEKGYGAFELG